MNEQTLATSGEQPTALDRLQATVRRHYSSARLVTEPATADGPASHRVYCGPFAVGSACPDALAAWASAARVVEREAEREDKRS